MARHLSERIMPHNCTNCNASAVTVGISGERLLTCSNCNAKEYSNQVDKYCHCGWWRKEV